MADHPITYSAISPYLMSTRAAEAIDWYRRAFAAEELERYGPPGRVGHATLRINGSTLFVSDEFPEAFAVVGTRAPESLGGTTVTVNLAVDDVDAWFGRAVAAGAVVLREPKDEFYGRQGKLRDPFGHVWSFVGPKAT